MPDIIITPSSGIIDFFPVSTRVGRIEGSGNTINVLNPSGYVSVSGSGMSVNTSSPNATFHVYSATSGATLLNLEGTNGSLFSVVDNLSGSLMSVNNNAGLPVFEVFSDDRVVGGRFGQNDWIITSGGNVGIGTGVPSSKFHVLGSVLFSSGLSVTGLITSNSGNFINSLTVNSTGVSISGHNHASSDISNFNSSVSGLVSGIYAPLSSPALIGTPTAPTASSGTNTTQIASTAFVRTEISNLVSSAPATLDTLNELAAALGNDASFSTTVTTNLAGKANLSGATFTGNISGPSGNFTSLKVNNIDVSASGHTHSPSDITNFNSSISGLLPVGTANYLSKFGTGGSGLINSLVFDNGTNVGIGTTSPSVQLDVIGSGRFRGRCRVDNLTINTDTTTDNTSSYLATMLLGSDGASLSGGGLQITSNTNRDANKALLGLVNNKLKTLSGSSTFAKTTFSSEYNADTSVASTQSANGNFVNVLTLESGNLTLINQNLYIKNSPTPTPYDNSAGDIINSQAYIYMQGASSGSPARFNNVYNYYSRGQFATSHSYANNFIDFYAAPIIGQTVPSGIITTRTALLIDYYNGNTAHITNPRGIWQLGSNVTNHLAGNLGIGTTTPAAQLQVVGTGLFTNIDINGSVLAGSAALTVNGGILTQGAFVRSSSFSIYGDNTTQIYKPDASTLGYAVASTGLKHSFGYNNAGTHTPWAVITSSGVGIGTTTPSGYLDVAGDVYVRGTGNNLGTVYFKSTSASSDTSLKVRADTNGNLYLDAANAYVKVGNQSADVVLNAGNGPITIGHNSSQTFANQYIKFTPMNSEVMRVTSSGVGIGTTTPSGQLHVIGTGIFSSGIGVGTNSPLDLIHISGSSVNPQGIRLENADGYGGSIQADNGALYFKSSTNTAFRVQSAKIRLGDGSSSSAIELSSYGSISQDGNGGGLTFSGTTAQFSNGINVTNSGTFTSGIITGSGSASSPSYSFIGNTNAGLYNPATNTISLATSGVNRLYIDPIGNVGIGNTPQAGFKLDVTGGDSIFRGAVSSNNYFYGYSTDYSVIRYQFSNSLAGGGANRSFVCIGGGTFGVGFPAPSGLVAISGGVAIGSNYNLTPPTNGLIVEGNVGVGTSSPNGRLHVNGTGLFDGRLSVSPTTAVTSPLSVLHVSGSVTDNASLMISGPLATRTYLGVGNSDTIPFLSSLGGDISTSIYGWGFFDRGTDGYLQIQRKGGASSWNGVMLFDRLYGNVGIGTGVSLGQYDKLTVDGNIKLGDTAGTKVQFYRGGGTVYDYTIGKEGNHLAISTASDGTTFRYTQFGYHASNGTWNPKTVINGFNGNVGVGTISPNTAARLTIVGSGNTSASAGLSIVNSSSSNILYVRDDGNVGIGTTNPTSTLQVSGLITANSGNFTQSLQLNGTGVSISGHTHTSNDITNFNSSVSGLLPNIANSGNNRILTSDGSNIGINANSNLYFSGNNKNYLRLTSITGVNNRPTLIIGGEGLSNLSGTASPSFLTNGRLIIAKSDLSFVDIDAQYNTFSINGSLDVDPYSAGQINCMNINAGTSLGGTISTDVLYINQNITSPNYNENYISLSDSVVVNSYLGANITLTDNIGMSCGGAIDINCDSSSYIGLKGVVNVVGSVDSDPGILNVYQNGSSDAPAQIHLKGQSAIDRLSLIVNDEESSASITCTSPILNISNTNDIISISSNTINLNGSVSINSTPLSTSQLINIINGGNLYLWSNFR